MEIHSIKLPKAQRFCCTKAHVREVFGDALTWVGFGWPSRSFRFDSRCHPRPRLRGPVVAKLTISRTRESYLILYPCPRLTYSDEALADFRARVAPAMRSWLEAEQAKPETAVLGYESFLAEWDGGSHRTHRVRFL